MIPSQLDDDKGANVPRQTSIDQIRCMHCGHLGFHPVVVRTGGSSMVQTGRCSNRADCEARQLRYANRIKAMRGER